MQFSLLMSIYEKEKVAYFNRCMQSIWEEQTVLPDEIILVQDGKLTPALYTAIEIWQKKIGDCFKSIILEENAGLGEALNSGVQHCSHALIARMDTDDIAMPHRFEQQLKVFSEQNIDVCSSWISEFDEDEKNIISFRKLPASHAEIQQFAKTRNPLNHPAVMYKKYVIEKAGGYQTMMWFEDYYLWIRMLINGAKMYNIQEPLVHMRAGYAQLQRRSGWKYALSELRFQKMLLRKGFITRFEFSRNMTIRMTARLIPKIFLTFVYKRLRD